MHGSTHLANIRIDSSSLSLRLTANLRHYKTTCGCYEKVVLHSRNVCLVWQIADFGKSLILANKFDEMDKYSHRGNCKVGESRTILQICQAFFPSNIPAVHYFKVSRFSLNSFAIMLGICKYLLCFINTIQLQVAFTKCPQETSIIRST